MILLGFKAAYREKERRLFAAQQPGLGQQEVTFPCNNIGSVENMKSQQSGLQFQKHLGFLK
jgi:hypothetical protein